jgi:hypothetical protein
MMGKDPIRPKYKRPVLQKGQDMFGRCLIHGPLILPGHFNRCPLCKSWVNVAEGQGLEGLEIVSIKENRIR